MSIFTEILDKLGLKKDKAANSGPCPRSIQGSRRLPSQDARSNRQARRNRPANQPAFHARVTAGGGGKPGRQRPRYAMQLPRQPGQPPRRPSQKWMSSKSWSSSAPERA